MKPSEERNWRHEFITCLFNCFVQIQKSHVEDIDNDELQSPMSIRPMIKETFRHIPKRCLWIWPFWLISYKRLLKIRDNHQLLQELERLLHRDQQYIDNIWKHADCIPSI